MEYLDLAAKLASAVDWRKVYPNPRVGCVIVQNGEVVATGVHERYGELHAEQKALAALFQTPNFKLQTSNKKLELYVTLEPCDDFQGNAKLLEVLYRFQYSFFRRIEEKQETEECHVSLGLFIDD